ncbi:unnamed protein product [Didymodactylos carnosus]|uniref:CTLH domain-containing protein n=1 Tax=Didymodactylos carnosus TaxID=1234261 RepID=A0A8S2CW78_9BILA|nr:unnamed protein product [Didymodactylos carnosus]CAF3534906.1 unnamed protein product [Didymodactylos carnosus]
MSNLRVNISISERDAVKLILDFLQNRELYISMLDIERETGIINGSFSEDILFLRQLILDGQWDDVVDFVQPLKTIDSFDAKQFIYIVLKYQFLELLCLKTEAQIENDLSVEQIVKFLNDLHPFCPSEQEYKKLSFLLTLKHLQDHPDYRNWNPSAGRVQCFHEVFPLVHRFLQIDKQTTSIGQGDRLVQLLVKGLLYESCVEHCQARATATDETIDLTDPNTLLLSTRLSDTDVSLLSWLHALPTETFSCPFEQKSLSLNIEKFQKPILEATWAEHVLSTPFKPTTMFPFNATPTGKPRSTELMSRSLAPQYDGLSYGLIRSQIFGDYNRNFVNDMSRSLAICNLKDNSLAHSAIGTGGGTSLPTVQEAIYEESASNNNQTDLHPTPPRIISPASSVISPSTTQRSQSPKRSVTGPYFSSHSNNNDIQQQQYQRSQQHISSPTSSSSHSPVLTSPTSANHYSQNNQNNHSHRQQNKTYTQTNGTNLASTPNEIIKPAVQTSSTTSNAHPVSRNAHPSTLPGINPISQQNIGNHQTPFPPQPHLSSMTDSSTDRLLKEYQKSRAEIVKQFEEQENRRNELQKQLSSPSAIKTRPLNDVTKYDSLEDIARSPAFLPLVSIEDVQAIRAVDVHQGGNYLAVGSNSQMCVSFAKNQQLRVCAYPELKKIAQTSPGSICCMSWSPNGRIIATGSNDKLIKLVRLDMDRPDDGSNNTEIELTHHNGTIRDLIFMHDHLRDDSILLSGGAGDCKVYVTDVMKQTPIRNYAGHQGHIYSLFAWDACSFVSGSQDGTSRIWDIRQNECVNVIAPRASNSPVAAVAVDNSGQLLAAAYEDATCLLYDLRGKRIVQTYQPHAGEIRSVRFSVHSYYLLTASYDKKVVMTSLNGDLTKPLILSNVAAHTDKIIQARWHPHEMSFVTTSADRTCVVWAPSALAAANL